MAVLLYRPPPRWQVWAAIAGALAIHGAAVAIASIHPAPPPPQDLENIPEAVEMSLDAEPAPPEPTPPPEEEPPPPPPPDAIPEQQPEFVEENKTPPPKRTPSNKPIAPIARPSNPAPSGPAPTGKAAMVYKPRIDYPYDHLDYLLGKRRNFLVELLSKKIYPKKNLYVLFEILEKENLRKKLLLYSILV